MNSMLLIASLMAMASSGDGTPADTQPTRGIGQYPGAPSEYFAPSVSWVESAQTLTNVALHRRAYASSTSDYNHTAHLVTDGIKDNSRPATLQASTPDGPLSRREAEWAIDGGPYSRNILMGAHSWLQYDWGGDMSVEAAQIRIQGLVAYDDKVATKGYTLRCQTSDDGLHWQTIGEQKGDKLPGQPLHYQLHSDPNKQESADMLPARRLDETIRFQLPMASDGLHARLMSTQHFRLLFDMDGAAHWDVHELSFLDSEQNVVEVMPSRQFSSMWVSNGGGTQWIYTDLGKSLPIEQLRLDWFLAPKKGVVEVSDDATNWRKVADLNNGATTDLNTSARYVRLLLLEPGEAGCYALREMEVMARQKVVYTPHAVAGMCDGKWMLSGGRWMLQRASEVKASGEYTVYVDDKPAMPMMSTRFRSRSSVPISGIAMSSRFHLHSTDSNFGSISMASTGKPTCSSMANALDASRGLLCVAGSMSRDCSTRVPTTWQWRLSAMSILVP